MWIAGLQMSAENDDRFDVAWFNDTKNEKFSIVGGWLESGFSADDRDLFCLSESNPKYVMAVKVIANDGPYTYCDFETLNMPVAEDGEVDDTLFILEWDTDAAGLAMILYEELERITKAYQEV
jgi:hypothetical protein